jgi:hypothetical protein
MSGDPKKTWYARRYHTGDLSGTKARVILKTESKTTLKAVTIKVISFNDPAFSGLRMEVWSMSGDNVRTKIATSENSWDLATLKTKFSNPVNRYGRRGIWFDFPETTLDADTFYSYVLTADSYTGDLNSHLAWVIDYPKPVYVHATPNNLGNLARIGNVLGLIEQQEREIQSDKYLVRVSPRDILLGSEAILSNDGATYDTYYWENIEKIPVSVEINGTVIPALGSIPVNVNGWFHDTATSRLYVAANPAVFPSWPTEQAIYFNYHLYLATEPVYTYSTPDDDSTDLVHWEPWATEIPNISRSVTDALVGFIPTSASSLTIENKDQFFNAFFTKTSFNKAPIKMWRMSGRDSSIEYLLNTLTSDVQTDYSTVTLTVNDDTEVFQNEVRPNQAGESDFYNTTDFPGIDPNYANAPKRIAYGKSFVKLVNIGYFAPGTTEANNNEFAVFARNMADSDLLFRSFYDQIDFGVGKTPVGSSTTRIWFKNDPTFMFFLDEKVVLINAPATYSDPPDFSTDGRTITGMNSVSKYIDINTSFTFQQTAGEDAFRCQVRAIYINQNGTLYTARPFVHFYGKSVNGASTVRFFTGYSSAIGMSPITVSDVVFADVEGAKFTDTDFDAPWDDTNSDMAQICKCGFRGVGIIYELLIRYAGIDPDEIDKAAFLTEIAREDSPDISFFFPQRASEQFGSIQDLLNKVLLSSGILRLYRNQDLKWTISRVEAFATSNAELTDASIQAISSKYNYNDLCSEVTLKYDYQEYNLALVDDAWLSTTVQNLKAKHFHKVNKSKEIELLLFNYGAPASAVQDYATRITNIFNERQGLHEIKASKEFDEFVLINDEYLISREKIGGKVYELDTEQSLKTRVLEMRRSINGISLVLDDQLGLGDNQ